MGRIILIDPFGWQGAASGYRPYPNVGIAYLVPALRQQGHNVKVIDMNNEVISAAGVIRQVMDLNADVVAFSAKTGTMKSVRVVAGHIKQWNPEMCIVIGGPHTTLAWRDLAVEPWFDYVVVGEGEHTFPSLCAMISEEVPIKDLPGVVRCGSNSDIPSTASSMLISSLDLDKLPFPDYELFPPNVRARVGQNYPLVTSRGCVYGCTYCSVPEIAGRGIRTRSVESLIEELGEARRLFGATAFEIIDDAFNAKMDRSKAICRALIESDLNMTWSCPNGIRADRVDTELAKLMFESGCRSVMVGVESADPNILASVKKGETLAQIEDGISILKQAGLHVGGYFIIGLPGDSIEAEKKSVEFAERLGIAAHFNMFVPYPGTELWSWAQSNARFLRDPEDCLHFADLASKVDPLIETDDFTAAERRSAYEMVHTRLKRFDMLIPAGLSRWSTEMEMIRLLVKYDPYALPLYVLRQGHNKAIAWLDRLLRRSD